MSLNRTEQMVFDYLQKNPDEGHFWRQKVREIVSGPELVAEGGMVLERELWYYLEERSRVASPFKEVAQREGLRRISLRNLSDHLIRLWGPPPKKKTNAGPG